RMSHGFQVQGTYTWSKSIDTSSASVAGDTFGNSISSLDWFDLRLNRALSDFNVGRTLVVNGTWELPTPKSWSAPAQWALGGWELGLIFTASDGVPSTPTWGTGSDPANTNSGDDWAYVNRLGGPGCKTLTNPGGVHNYIKKISEKFNVQFRAEIFNILNHANFAPPITPTNTDIFDGTGNISGGAASPTAGLLTKTTTSSRQIQFALKVIF